MMALSDRGSAGFPQDAHARDAGRDLFQQFHPFPGQAEFELDEARDIAVWSPQTLDVTSADRVDALAHDDRHGAASLLQRRRGRADAGQNDLRAERNQFGRISAQARGIAHAPAIIDPQVAPDRPAQLLEPLHEGREARLRLRLVGTRMHEHSNAPYRLALLCARHEWPCRRAADERDELAPPHSITSSAKM
jgi:hypothetical protein